MKPIIPGAYEPNTLRYRQLGSIGALGAGARDVIPTGPSLMDAATIAERRREGGFVAKRPSWLRRLFGK